MGNSSKFTASDLEIIEGYAKAGYYGSGNVDDDTNTIILNLITEIKRLKKPIYILVYTEANTCYRVKISDNYEKLIAWNSIRLILDDQSFDTDIDEIRENLQKENTYSHPNKIFELSIFKEEIK